MYDLQAALDERAASLKNNKSHSKQSVNPYTSKVYIERSLKQAGILNHNGKMVDKVKVPSR